MRVHFILPPKILICFLKHFLLISLHKHIPNDSSELLLANNFVLFIHGLFSGIKASVMVNSIALFLLNAHEFETCLLHFISVQIT
jgi:hypothetical protein